MSNIYTTKGKVIVIGDVQTGTSKDGKEWQRTNVVIDTGDKYNNILSLTAFGKLVDDVASIAKGSTISAEFTVSSREHQGKYYTEAAMKQFAVFGQGDGKNATRTT